MHLYLYILLYYLTISRTFAKVVEIKCPKQCKCDIFETLRRATCSNKNLAAIQSNLLSQTQYLDLSHNHIIKLEAHIFLKEKLDSLKLLNISYNRISEIDLNAFNGLNHLKTLDLSYNGIQYFRKNWFWPLESLEELYLKGNSFDRLYDGPLFASTTLKRLDLSNCHISFIANDVFSELPNLKILDISHNFLIHFNVESIQPLTKLQILVARNNSFVCDSTMFKLTNHTRQRGIRFENPCPVKMSDTEKFQKMINAPEQDDEKNSWIYDDNEEATVDNATKIKNECNTTSDKTSLLQEIVDLSPVLSIIIPFTYGIGVGILIASIYQLNLKRKNTMPEGTDTYVNFDEGYDHLQRNPKRVRSTSFKSLRTQRSTEEQQTLPLREWGISESTPVLYRKNQLHI